MHENYLGGGGAHGTATRVSLAFVAAMGLVVAAAPAVAQHYHTHAEIGTLLQQAEDDYPTLCQRYNLGSSHNGREIWALRISDNVGVEEDEPEFKYISTMHGDETVGTVMCMYLIDHMLENYGTDDQVTELIDGIDVWIVPLMNPDGYESRPRTRVNAQGIDLNRNFPEGSYPTPEPNDPTGRATETQVIMNWSFGESFTLSANFHTGVVVVNYPFDRVEGIPSGSYAACPDDDLFIVVSEEYSYYNSPMWNGSWYHGITNGSDWYSIDGGMQDWSYRYMGCNEVTVELSNSDEPAVSELPTYWENNRQSMLHYMATCLIGIRGIVTDGQTGLPVAATVAVEGREHDIFTDPDIGDYHRMLLPGTYDLLFTADGYDPLLSTGVVVAGGDATRLDVELWAGPVVAYPNGGELVPASVPTSVTWTGSPNVQFHVQYTANAESFETITDGFESGSLDPEYDTGGDADWFVTTGIVHSGSYSARAGDINDRDVSWMTRTVAGGDLGFWYRVSSEDNYDWFNFSVDGDQKIHASGQGAWTYYATTLAPGMHDLRWEYTKDISVSEGSDTVWIDDLEITIDNTTWTDIIALTPVGATSTQWTPPAVGSDYKVRVRSYQTGDLYGEWDESDATFSVVSSADPIPAVSDWGLVVMILLVLTAGTVVYQRNGLRRNG
jgi:carboxypeptidase D